MNHAVCALRHHPKISRRTTFSCHQFLQLLPLHKDRHHETSSSTLWFSYTFPIIEPEKKTATSVSARRSLCPEGSVASPSCQSGRSRIQDQCSCQAKLPVRFGPRSASCTTPRCGCTLKRIGEDVIEKLDYTPGLFTVERHIRGKWACAKCQTLIQEPVPAQIIDKGIPTAGLLAQVLVAKYADHLPLYRQEGIFARAGMALPRSTLSAWAGVCGVQLQPLVDALKNEILSHAVLHADETPVAMLKPGNKKTHRAYLWAYAPGAFEDLKAVVYDFCESRAGEHARTFLGDWKGALVCDDFAGYKQSFALGITEAGCLAHSRRKLY